MSKKIEKPDLQSQAYITVGQPEGFEMIGLKMVKTFYIIVQPFIEKEKTIEMKLNNSYQVQFNYESKKGIPIGKICENLESMAQRIREHYGGKIEKF